MSKLLSKKIKNLRLNYGWTQQEIANKLNISQSTYQRIERGIGASFHYYLSAIASLYGIEERELFDSIHQSNISKSNSSISENNEDLKISKLYESIIAEKDQNKALLEKLLEQKEKYIALLEKSAIS